MANELVGGGFALGGIATGWLLNEASQLVRRHERTTEALNEVLTDLMEIRHRLRGMQATIDMVSRLLEGATGVGSDVIKPFVAEQMRLMYPEFSADSELIGRYNVAVGKLSSTRPALAFRLRGKEWVMTMGNRIASLPLETDEEKSALFRMHEGMLKQVMPVLDATIREVASALGRKIKNEVNFLLSRPAEIPPEYEQMLGQHFKAFAQATPEG